MFDYMLVSKPANAFFGYAYCIGTKLYCMEYQMRKGLRASTEIIYCPEPPTKEDKKQA